MKLEALALNGTSVLSGKHKAFLTTYTYDIVLPHSLFSKYTELIYSLNITGMNCSDGVWCISQGKCSDVLDSLPNLEIQLDGYRYTLPPLAYTLQERFVLLNFCYLSVRN